MFPEPTFIGQICGGKGDNSSSARVMSPLPTIPVALSLIDPLREFIDRDPTVRVTIFCEMFKPSGKSRIII